MVLLQFKMLPASKIQARHELIVVTIGAFEEEKMAFDLMSRLIWQLPLFMAITALLDLILVVVYMNWLHPWRGILEDVSRSLSSNLTIFLHRDQRSGGLSVRRRDH